jgi:4-hydroxyphenylpyruvate dioxygenase
MAREYANPYSASGLQRGPVQSAAFLKRHLAELMATVPGDKIYLFQIADAGLPAPSSPASTPPSLESGIPRLQPWSRNCRLFPLETERGAFLPVPQYAAAVLQTGYSGDLSLEVFNASLSETGIQVPIEHAERGYCALKKLDASLRSKSRDLRCRSFILRAAHLQTKTQWTWRTPTRPKTS